MNVLRQRKQALKIVKELDAFPKVPESYKETTASGGGVSLIVFGLCLILVVSEVRYYAETELKFDYEVDGNHTGKLKLNVDITVAMKCGQIGADVLDHTGSTAASFGRLGEQKTYFELTSSQHAHLQMVQQVNNYIKNEYHAIHHLLWKSGYSGSGTAMPLRSKAEEPEREPDACRVYGTLELNKLAGNFHITAGKAVGFMGGTHAHLTLMGNQDYNFSHRIDHFSFGEKTPGVVNPLDAEFQVTATNHFMYQYFIQVVPTNVNTMAAQVDTFQYAVTEHSRPISHSKGSHGIPGIYMKYDLSALKVNVKEERKPFWKFVTRLCGIVGGIFATSGILHSAIGYILNCVFCRDTDKDAGDRKSSSQVSPATPAGSAPSPPPAGPAPPHHQSLLTNSLLTESHSVPSQTVVAPSLMTSAQTKLGSSSVTLLAQPCDDEIPL